MTIPFISEKLIDAVSENLSGDNQNYDQAIVEMQAAQPILFSYLLSESFKLLTKEEKEYLLYISLVLWKTIDSQQAKLTMLNSEIIEEVEEKNWTLFNEAKGRTFRDKLDVFFDDYPQEDLLAVAEDALVEDEDSFVTKEGRDLIFIGLKTVIDTLCKLN